MRETERELQGLYRALVIAALIVSAARDLSRMTRQSVSPCDPPTTSQRVLTNSVWSCRKNTRPNCVGEVFVSRPHLLGECTGDLTTQPR